MYTQKQSLGMTQRSKDQGHMVTKPAWSHGCWSGAAYFCATCDRCRCGSTCRYDCLFSSFISFYMCGLFNVNTIWGTVPVI